VSGNEEILVARRPTDAQLRSRRTVLRVQYLADRLRDDIKDAGFDQVDAVLFLQRYWKDENESTQRRYIANCCATYRFKKEHLEEIKNSLGGNGNGDSKLLQGSLKTLFACGSEQFEEFTRQIGSVNLDDYDPANPPKEIQLAHNALIESISSVPYSGELPSAFDQNIANHSFLFFRKKPDVNGSASDAKFEWMSYNDNASYSDLATEKANFVVDGLSSDSVKALQSAFDEFLNAFMIGALDMSKFQGIAVPCYEKWTKHHRDGGFLGWIILKFEEIPNNWDDHKVTRLQLLVNHFAERVMDATLVEVIGEYAEACRTTGSAKGPEEAFKDYFPRIEGWAIDEVQTDKSLPLKLFRTNGDGEFEVHITKKHDTLPEDMPSAPPDAVVVRSQRLYRALEAFYSAAKAEGYKKQAQMLELIERPLRAISDALGSMQSETQELRSILFEPEEALFASHAEISEFFKEGHHLPFEGDLAKQYKIKHSPKAAGGAGYTDAEAQVVLSCMIATIFGEFQKIRHLPDARMVVSTTVYIIARKAKDEGTKSLVKDLAWLLTKDETNDLAKFLVENSGLQDAIQRVKDALFTPFKGFSSKWHPLPFQLLGRSLSPDPANPCALIGKVSQDAEITLPRSPMTQAAVLAFLRDFAKAASKARLRYPSQLGIEESGSNVTLTMTFSSAIPQGKEGITTDFLRKSLRLMARRLPPEWRVESSHFGDMTRPFVYLLNKVIGLRDTRETPKEGGWWEAESCTGDDVFSLAYMEAGTNTAGASFKIQISSNMKSILLIWLKAKPQSGS
jgi:hypothetical protein